MCSFPLLCLSSLTCHQTHQEERYLCDFDGTTSRPVGALPVCGARHVQDRGRKEEFLRTRVNTSSSRQYRRSDLSSFSYKEAGEALRRKQDKEREAAGLPPVQRGGARGGAQRGAQRGGRGFAPPPRGGRGGGGGGGGYRGGHGGTVDKNLYVHLLGHLRKKALLPVVVFTLSKKRCEENASTLTNQDLCSAIEKSEVHVAIEKALSRLKGNIHPQGLHNSLSKIQALTRSYLKSVV